MDFPVLSAERLAPAVRRALQAPEAWPVRWTCEPIEGPGINPSTAGLYRVHGTAGLDGPTSEDVSSAWRMVLKVVHLPDLQGTLLEKGYIDAPEDWNYWRREVLARRSGLLDPFTSPLRPVACWATEDVDDTTAWLWLEELDMPHPPVFTLVELATAAHDLGAFAALGVPLAEEVQRMPWVAQDWLRGWLTTIQAVGGDHALSHDGCWTHPLVSDRLPASVRRSYGALMASAGTLLDRLDRLPRTVGHLDAQASNLCLENGPEGHRTVLIDWGFLGAVPIGEDLGHHIAQNVFFGVVDPAESNEHERSATEAYLKGLRAYGWHGNDNDVEFAAAAAGALRMLPFAATYLAELCPVTGEPDQWPEEMARKQGREVETVMNSWCRAVIYLAQLADRATRLLVDE